MAKLVTGGELNLDNNPLERKENEHSFALNVVNSSSDNDMYMLSNEESNEFCFDTTEKIPLGKVYMGNGDTAICFVDIDGRLSEIGIFSDNCVYVPHVISRDLGFRVHRPIDIVFRLRKGCERTIYFTDDENKPRYYNFDKPQNFCVNYNPSLGPNQDWEESRFDLFTTYSSTPVITNIEVEEGGDLMSGSYSFAVQLVDNELNSTEFITTVEPVIIFSDSLKNKYNTISGSSGKKQFYRREQKTSKRIKMSIQGLDPKYSFFRVAVVCSNDGSGIPNKVYISDIIPITNPFFTFSTESNMINKTTVEEIQVNKNVINKVKNIEQIENRLILSNTQSKQTKFCNLQKYASKIKTDCITETINHLDLNSLNNQKRPTIYHEKLGYQPGEIYAFGIVYIFADNTLSPVYHIPGRNSSTVGKTYTTGNNVYPMSIDCESETQVYSENNVCQGNVIWGLDSEGATLKGKKIRNHRFPLRSELKLPLVKQQVSNKEAVLKKLYTDVWIKRGDCGIPLIYLRVDYIKDGVSLFKVLEIKMKCNGSWSDGGVWNVVDSTTGTLTFVELYTCDVNGNRMPIENVARVSWWNHRIETENIKEQTYTGLQSEILGIRFSGIELPPFNDVNDYVVGYYIVRCERKEEDKTILDTGVLFPLLNKNDKYIASGMMFPRCKSTDEIDKRTMSIVHPEYKFNSKEYKDYEIIQEGYFERSDFRLTTSLSQGVQAGTSYNPEVEVGGDNDGLDLRIFTRQNWLEYKSLSEPKIYTKNDIEEYFNLTVLRSKDVSYSTNSNNSKKTIYNVCGDNNEAHFTLKNDRNIDLQNEEIRKPFVVMRRKLSENYSDFRIRPYYRQSEFTSIYQESVDVFRGDSFISSMNYNRSMYYETRPALRPQKTQDFWETIAGVAIALGGLALTIFSGGTLAVVGVGMMIFGIGMAVTNTISNIELGEVLSIYNTKWQEGLQDCVRDQFTEEYFIFPKDDEIRWFTDLATNLWFESTVNCNWRLKADDIPYFLESPGNLVSRHNINDYQLEHAHTGATMTNNTTTGNAALVSSMSMYPKVYEAVTTVKDYVNSYILSKLVALDTDNKNGKLYKGNVNPEIYDENPDFKRRNREKIYYHLAEEYDCCSKCTEDFPHRIYYSEQSYQEELSDNYKQFLHNNYKDIDGETGEIMDIFKLGNDLYVHTTEALWKMPKSYQERVTGEITSFIGTGSFFEIPPQKMIDDDTGNSVGIQHKWSSVKVKDSYYFVSERERKIYKFDGKSIVAISDDKNFKWFWDNIPSDKADKYFNDNQKDYPFKDNTTNPIGVGFIAVHDAEKQRIIFTKKDYSLPIPATSNYHSIYCNGRTIIFYNYSELISSKEREGWTYLGIKDCKLEFGKYKRVCSLQKRIVRRNKFKNVDYLIFRYNFTNVNGKDLDTRSELLLPISEGPIGFNRITNLSGRKYLLWGGDQQDYGVESILIDVKKIKEDFPGQTEIKFSCAAWWYGTRANGNMNMNAEGWQGGTMSRTNNKDFANIGGNLMGTYSFPTVNINIPPSSSAGTIDANLQPYNQMGVFTFNIETGELSANGLSGGSVPPEIEEVFEDVEVCTLVPEYSYIDGEQLSDSSAIDTSWSLSYSLPTEDNPNGTWLSFHSYRPQFYVHTQKKFFSWLAKTQAMWRHNVANRFQNFYNKSEPMILELTLKSEDLDNKIWDYISFLTEAKIFDESKGSYINIKDVTFNSIEFYNTRQASGNKVVIHKNYSDVWNVPSSGYIETQITDASTTVLAEKDEKEWTINQIRDYVVTRTEPLYIENKFQVLQSGKYNDKIVNINAVNMAKDWMQLEAFRDKFITVRFTFSNFATNHDRDRIKLIFNYLRNISITSTRQ